MAKKQTKRRAKEERLELNYGPWNWGLLLGGVVLAGLGFWLLYLGDVVWSTVLLVLGYGVLVPVGLLIRVK